MEVSYVAGIDNYTVFKNGWVEVPRQQGHFVVADLFETLEVNKWWWLLVVKLSV
jgi:hypothetical protein